MLSSIQQYINSLIDELDRNVVIEDVIFYEKAKLEYALSTTSHMASISILPDLTYDFFAEEIASEEVYLMKTKYFSSTEELFSQLTKDILSFSEL
ncbi:hypothetical protein D3C75_624760 [compost metagenome]